MQTHPSPFPTVSRISAQSQPPAPHTISHRIASYPATTDTVLDRLIPPHVPSCLHLRRCSRPPSATSFPAVRCPCINHTPRPVVAHPVRLSSHRLAQSIETSPASDKGG